MEFGRIGLALCLALASAISVQGRSLGRISPELRPESSKKFFKKDYPDDKRPGVNVLHFGHPYPVIQDSSEFDNDYVKDENNDNGHWKAQQEYDRLRHKLQKEEKEAAKALEKKQEEEQELKHALDKYNKETAEHKEALAKKPEDDKEEEKDALKEASDNDTKEKKGSESSWSWNWWPFSWPKWSMPDFPEAKPAPTPAPAKEGADVRGASKDTEKAVDNLKDCQKELAEAKGKLEKLMGELDKAKANQTEAEEAVARAKEEEKEAQKVADDLHDKTSEERAEHKAAKEAYLKQKAVVDKMQADLDAAEAKVKAYRDAEDSNGGVYNTDDAHKSFCTTASIPRILVLLMASYVSWISL